MEHMKYSTNQMYEREREKERVYVFVVYLLIS